MACVSRSAGRSAERQRPNANARSSPTSGQRPDRTNRNEVTSSPATSNPCAPVVFAARRSEEHTSELQSLMRISYAVFCLKKKHTHKNYMRINSHYHQHKPQHCETPTPS